MKTAVSIPDDVFQAAEKLAAELNLSRSALYAKALKEMLERLKEEAFAAQMNAALAEHPDELDPVLARANRRLMALPEE